MNKVVSTYSWEQACAPHSFSTISIRMEWLQHKWNPFVFLIYAHITTSHHIAQQSGNHGGAEDVINSNSNGVLLIFVWVLSFQHHPVCYGTIQTLISHLLSVCCLIHRIAIAHRIHPILCSFAIAVLFMILLQQGLTVDYYLLYKKYSSLLNPIAVIHASSESLNI